MSDPAINFRDAQFIISAPNISHLQQDNGAEVAFAGRSNAGKSSALNTLTRQKQLARTSKTPGRTQLINLFDIGNDCRIADLPGYGFAQVPLAVKRRWQKALTEYLEQRDSLCAVVVLMDIRHPMKEIDQQLIQWAVQSELPVLVLLTKSDKLKSGARKQTLLAIREASLAFCGDVSVEVFSATKQIGVDKLEKFIRKRCQAQLALEKE